MNIWLNAWTAWWKAFYGPVPKSDPTTILPDDLAKALEDHIRSARLVAERAAQNVEDAELISNGLKQWIEQCERRKRERAFASSVNNGKPV